MLPSESTREVLGDGESCGVGSGLKMDVEEEMGAEEVSRRNLGVNWVFFGLLENAQGRMGF